MGVEARILQCRMMAEDVLDLGLRIIAEVRDLAKPENLEDSVREFRESVNAPKCRKAAGRDWTRSEQLRLRLWPCTAQQAGAFTIQPTSSAQDVVVDLRLSASTTSNA